MATNEPNVVVRLLPRLRRLAAQVVFRLGRTTTRLGILALTTVALVYLLYQYGWQSLTRPTELPPGVTASALEVNAALLQRITTQRINRTQAPRQDFTAAQQLIVPPPRPTAAPR